MVADPAALQSHLLAARAQATLMTQDLEGERLFGPRLAIVNPPLWELGHLAWFQERWCLRPRPAGSLGESILPGADTLYDSSAVAHATRWDLPLPTLAGTRAYMAEVLELVCTRLAREPENAALAYYARLAAFHEDMHAEAFHTTRQTLGYPDPCPGATAQAQPQRGEAEFAGGRFEMGSRPDADFVFDNEKWAHDVEVAPFRMARSVVSNAEFLAYVEDGGAPPRYWKQLDGVWMQRRFDRWLPLAAEEPVRHVSALEAEAYCRWAQRRLPTEAEWECAAASGMSLAGSVWEWTSSAFLPYPGFFPDPYEDYSQPWFGTHRVLRGGSFATPGRLVRSTFRNFYTSERGDVFCGLRTCAL
jgi:iron(II)-dependent oxidoreductase